MNKVKVLIEGYAKEVEGGWVASSTVTLVYGDDKKIIVDPGCNRQRLIEELSKNGLKPSDIDFVLLTHNHTDHALLVGIFDKARVLNNETIFDNDEIVDHNNKIPETNLEIIQTPGHDNDHCSLVVKTDEGIYVVAGDVFWWTDKEEQVIDINKTDLIHATDMERLVESRKRVLEIGDYIIPGHGKVFKP